MRHALSWLIIVWLALPAPAQEQQSGPPVDPPAAAQPAAPTDADKPAAPVEAANPETAKPETAKPEITKHEDANAPPDASTSAEMDKPPDAVKPIVTTDAQRSICLLIEASARTHGLPVEFFARVIWQESRFRANAVGPVTRSGRRAQGIAQFMPGTAAERQLLNPFDPIQALPKSAEFLSELRRQFGNLGLAAAAYNAGPRRVREWLSGTGPMPSETRHYVYAITGSSVEQWSKGGDAADKRQQGGSDCGTLMATLKRAPNPFVEALEVRVAASGTQPWGVILTAGFSRTAILGQYASLERLHSNVLAGVDPTIVEQRLLTRGTRPFYQVRIGAPDRAAAYSICNSIRKNRGACVILRNPQKRA
jgi:soluble lytic murein transglycosylase-like protein